MGEEPRQAYRRIFSAIHHMERIGFALSEQYCQIASTPEEKAFAETQRREEGRHVAVCKQLTRLHGELEPPSPYLRRMERTLVESTQKSAKLLGLLGGDIMGDFLIRRLLATPVGDEARQVLRSVLSDEVKHIEFLTDLLEVELAALSGRQRFRCIGTQMVLLLADLQETSRLGGCFAGIGLDPRVESMMCYLYYRSKCRRLIPSGSLFLLPSWLVRLAGPAAYRCAQDALPAMLREGSPGLEDLNPERQGCGTLPETERETGSGG